MIHHPPRDTKLSSRATDAGTKETPKGSQSTEGLHIQEEAETGSPRDLLMAKRRPLNEKLENSQSHAMHAQLRPKVT